MKIRPVFSGVVTYTNTTYEATDYETIEHNYTVVSCGLLYNGKPLHKSTPVWFIHTQIICIDL